MTQTAAEIKLPQSFSLQMYRAEQEARHQGHPVCPVIHGTRVELDGTVYAVRWTSRGGTSRTMKLDALVVNLSTGRSMGIEGIISKLVRGGEQLCLPRAGTWMGRDAAALALAGIAARHTQALVFHNPVTGSVFVGVSA